MATSYFPPNALHKEVSPAQSALSERLTIAAAFTVGKEEFATESVKRTTETAASGLSAQSSALRTQFPPTSPQP